MDQDEWERGDAAVEEDIDIYEDFDFALTVETAEADPGGLSLSELRTKYEEARAENARLQKEVSVLKAKDVESAKKAKLAAKHLSSLLITARREVATHITNYEKLKEENSQLLLRIQKQPQSLLEPNTQGEPQYRNIKHELLQGTTQTPAGGREGYSGSRLHRPGTQAPWAEDGRPGMEDRHHTRDFPPRSLEGDALPSACTSRQARSLSRESQHSTATLTKSRERRSSENSPEDWNPEADLPQRSRGHSCRSRSSQDGSDPHRKNHSTSESRRSRCRDSSLDGRGRTTSYDDSFDVEYSTKGYTPERSARYPVKDPEHGSGPHLKKHPLPDSRCLDHHGRYSEGHVRSREGSHVREHLDEGNTPDWRSHYPEKDSHWKSRDRREHLSEHDKRTADKGQSELFSHRQGELHSSKGKIKDSQSYRSSQKRRDKLHDSAGASSGTSKQPHHESLRTGGKHCSMEQSLHRSREQHLPRDFKKRHGKDKSSSRDANERLPQRREGSSEAPILEPNREWDVYDDSHQRGRQHKDRWRETAPDGHHTLETELDLLADRKGRGLRNSKRKKGDNEIGEMDFYEHRARPKVSGVKTKGGEGHSKRRRKHKSRRGDRELGSLENFDSQCLPHGAKRDLRERLRKKREGTANLEGFPEGTRGGHLKDKGVEAMTSLQDDQNLGHQVGTADAAMKSKISCTDESVCSGSLGPSRKQDKEVPVSESIIPVGDNCSEPAAGPEKTDTSERKMSTGPDRQMQEIYRRYTKQATETTDQSLKSLHEVPPVGEPSLDEPPEPGDQGGREGFVPMTSCLSEVCVGSEGTGGIMEVTCPEHRGKGERAGVSGDQGVSTVVEDELGPIGSLPEQCEVGKAPSSGVGAENKVADDKMLMSDHLRLSTVAETGTGNMQWSAAQDSTAHRHSAETGGKPEHCELPKVGTGEGRREPATFIGTAVSSSTTLTQNTSTGFTLGAVRAFALPTQQVALEELTGHDGSSPQLQEDLEVTLKVEVKGHDMSTVLPSTVDLSSAQAYSETQISSPLCAVDVTEKQFNQILDQSSTPTFSKTQSSSPSVALNEDERQLSLLLPTATQRRPTPVHTTSPPTGAPPQSAASGHPALEGQPSGWADLGPGDSRSELSFQAEPVHSSDAASAVQPSVPLTSPGKTCGGREGEPGDGPDLHSHVLSQEPVPVDTADFFPDMLSSFESGSSSDISSTSPPTDADAVLLVGDFPGEEWMQGDVSSSDQAEPRTLVQAELEWTMPDAESFLEEMTPSAPLDPAAGSSGRQAEPEMESFAEQFLSSPFPPQDPYLASDVSPYSVSTQIQNNDQQQVRNSPETGIADVQYDFGNKETAAPDVMTEFAEVVEEQGSPYFASERSSYAEFDQATPMYLLHKHEQGTEVTPNYSFNENVSPGQKEATPGGEEDTSFESGATFPAEECLTSLLQQDLALSSDEDSEEAEALKGSSVENEQPGTEEDWAHSEAGTSTPKVGSSSYGDDNDYCTAPSENALPHGRSSDKSDSSRSVDMAVFEKGLPVGPFASTPRKNMRKRQNRAGVFGQPNEKDFSSDEMLSGTFVGTQQDSMDSNRTGSFHPQDSNVSSFKDVTSEAEGGDGAHRRRGEDDGTEAGISETGDVLHFGQRWAVGGEEDEVYEPESGGAEDMNDPECYLFGKEQEWEDELGQSEEECEGEEQEADETWEGDEWAHDKQRKDRGEEKEEEEIEDNNIEEEREEAEYGDGGSADNDTVTEVPKKAVILGTVPQENIQNEERTDSERLGESESFASGQDFLNSSSEKTQAESSTSLHSSVESSPKMIKGRTILCDSESSSSAVTLPSPLKRKKMVMFSPLKGSETFEEKIQRRMSLMNVINEVSSPPSKKARLFPKKGSSKKGDESCHEGDDTSPKSKTKISRSTRKDLKSSKKKSADVAKSSPLHSDQKRTSEERRNLKKKVAHPQLTVAEKAAPPLKKIRRDQACAEIASVSQTAETGSDGDDNSSMEEGEIVSGEEEDEDAVETSENEALKRVPTPGKPTTVWTVAPAHVDNYQAKRRAQKVSEEFIHVERQLPQTSPMEEKLRQLSQSACEFSKNREHQRYRDRGVHDQHQRHPRQQDEGKGRGRVRGDDRRQPFSSHPDAFSARNREFRMRRKPEKEGQQPYRPQRRCDRRPARQVVPYGSAQEPVQKVFGYGLANLPAPTSTPGVPGRALQGKGPPQENACTRDLQDLQDWHRNPSPLVNLRNASLAPHRHARSGGGQPGPNESGGVPVLSRSLSLPGGQPEGSRGARGRDPCSSRWSGRGFSAQGGSCHGSKRPRDNSQSDVHGKRRHSEDVC